MLEKHGFAAKWGNARFRVHATPENFGILRFVAPAIDKNTRAFRGHLNNLVMHNDRLRRPIIGGQATGRVRFLQATKSIRALH